MIIAPQYLKEGKAIYALSGNYIFALIVRSVETVEVEKPFKLYTLERYDNKIIKLSESQLCHGTGSYHYFDSLDELNVQVAKFLRNEAKKLRETDERD